MTMHWIFAILIALAASALQIYALRAAAKASSNGARLALLIAKPLLWAGVFAALALGGKTALITGGLAAGVSFPAAALLYNRKIK